MLLKRRFWLEIDNSLQVGDTKEDNKLSFIWTQNTIDNVFKIQKGSVCVVGAATGTGLGVGVGTGGDNARNDSNSNMNLTVNIATLPEQAKKM